MWLSPTVHTAFMSLTPSSLPELVDFYLITLKINTSSPPAGLRPRLRQSFQTTKTASTTESRSSGSSTSAAPRAVSWSRASRPQSLARAST